jgi:hypothetical protein
VGCGLWVVGCGLWVVLWAWERCVLRYPFCRPPRQTKPPKNDGDEIDPQLQQARLNNLHALEIVQR